MINRLGKFYLRTNLLVATLLSSCSGNGGEEAVKLVDFITNFEFAFQELDLDGDGFLSREEFLAMYSNIGEDPVHIYSEEFDYKDKDGDGRVSRVEFSSDEFDTFRCVDENGDEELSYDEQRTAINRCQSMAGPGVES